MNFRLHITYFLIFTLYLFSFQLWGVTESIRIVPQLDITSFTPTKVRFLPQDESKLIVLNRDGRIDVLDISDINKPIKYAEFYSGAKDFALNPALETAPLIATANINGTVKLWSLEGKSAADPFTGHHGKVNSVAFSPDGNVIASAGEDGSIRLWTRAGGSTTSPFKGHDGPVYSVAFSPDGNTIASGGEDETVRLWTKEGKPAVAPFEGHDSSIRNVIFSPDGNTIASAGFSSMIKLWSLEGQVHTILTKHTIPTTYLNPIGHFIKDIAFTRDGNMLASTAYGGTVDFWTLTGKPAAEPFKDHQGHSVYSIAFSLNGDRIASAGADDTVRLWKLKGRSTFKHYSNHVGPAYSVAYSPDGNIVASAGEDGTIRLWTKDGKPAINPFKAHDTGAIDVDFSPKGNLIASTGYDGTVRLWSLKGNPIGQPFRGHKGYAMSVTFSPDGNTIASAGKDHTVRLWTLKGKALEKPFIGHTGTVFSVTFSPDGNTIASASADDTVRLWTLKGKQKHTAMKGHGGKAYSVTFSPDGNTIATAGDPVDLKGTVRLWTKEGKPLTNFTSDPIRSIHRVIFSPDGNIIAAASSDGAIRLWSLDGESVEDPLIGCNCSSHNSLTDIAFSPDGHTIVSASRDGVIRFWKKKAIPIGEPIRGHDSLIKKVFFSKAGQPVTSIGRDGTLKDLSAVDKPVIKFMSDQLGWVRSADLSPDGSTIVLVRSGMTVNLFTLDGNLITDPFKGHNDTVNSVAFSPDGNTIASADKEGTIRLWTKKGNPVSSPILGHNGWINSIAFSPDGNTIASSGQDATIKLWTRKGNPTTDPFKVDHGEVNSVAFSPDGNTLAATTYSGRVLFLNAKTMQKIDEASLADACNYAQVYYPDNNTLWLQCYDRLIVMNRQFKEIGQYFLLGKELAPLSSEGLFTNSAEVETAFKAFGEDGTLLTRRNAIPEISAKRVQQLFFNQWTIKDRMLDTLNKSYQWTNKSYQNLGLLKVPFWPLLTWVLTILFVLTVWLVSPRKLAHWAMLETGVNPAPRFKGFADTITLFSYLGHSKRTLKAWFEYNYPTLLKVNFLDRKPVLERQRFYPLDNAQLEKHVCLLRQELPFYLWITGNGGGGKSSQAYYVMKEAIKHHRLLPVLVDEDWSGTLQEHIAKLLVVKNRHPTPAMLETLGAMGLICPIIDSISERNLSDPFKDIANIVHTGIFKKMLATSRTPLPEGATGERFEQYEVSAVQSTQLSDFIAVYTTNDQIEDVEQAIEQFIKENEKISPLFLRFAIEQALKGTQVESSPMELVLRYVEALRKDRLDINEDDMRRCACIIAYNSMSANKIPMEFEEPVVRGILIREAQIMAFMDNAKSDNVEPAKIIDMLLTGGLLERKPQNHRLQFTYDPVAEELASLYEKNSTN